MSRLILCQNTAGSLIGMRSIVTQFAADTMAEKTVVMMNIIGTTAGTGITCSSLLLDVVNGEYLQSLTFSWLNAGKIDYAKAVSSKGQTLSMGQTSTSMVTKQMLPNVNNQILAFYGYENTNVAELQAVQVDVSCVKGVTSVSSVQMVDVFDVDTMSATKPTQMSGAILGAIIGGVVGGVVLSLTFAVLIYIGIKRNWCARKVFNQTTPKNDTLPNAEGLSLSFKRASEADKRKSIKEF
jgi:hypothetical protein